jgi:hypothetical protein
MTGVRGRLRDDGLPRWLRADQPVYLRESWRRIHHDSVPYRPEQGARH